MRTITTVGSVLLVIALANMMPALAQDVATAQHKWSEIAYPALPALSDGSPAPNLVVQNGKEEGLRLTLSFYVSNSDGEPRREQHSPEKISARLHSGDGKITDPEGG